MFFKELPNEYSKPFIEMIIKIGVVEPLFINVDGYEFLFRSFVSYFLPLRHIPLTNTTRGMNISPV